MIDVIVNSSTGKVISWATSNSLSSPIPDGHEIIVSEELDYSPMKWEYNFETKKFVIRDYYKWDAVRKKRNLLLSDSDYTQLADSTYPSTQDAWKIYRQELRDITKGVTDPDTIVFPEEPK
tara:strand:+ start:172 stop:534 length:363 start_codon:yes stop_codon:yes gene_type:complete